jgi:hypothetical protein
MKTSSTGTPIRSAAFRIIYFAALPAMLSAPSVVMRLALEIFSATLTAALLLCIDPSGDMTELAARVKSKASSGFSK